MLGEIRKMKITSYKNMQIIKHALMYYIGRMNISDKELREENKLLKEVCDHVEDLKKRYNIK